MYKTVNWMSIYRETNPEYKKTRENVLQKWNVLSLPFFLLDCLPWESIMFQLVELLPMSNFLVRNILKKRQIDHSTWKILSVKVYGYDVWMESVIPTELWNVQRMKRVELYCIRFLTHDYRTQKLLSQRYLNVMWE